MKGGKDMTKLKEALTYLLNFSKNIKSKAKTSLITQIKAINQRILPIVTLADYSGKRLSK